MASLGAVAKHSSQLYARVALASRDALVACGKSWVLCNGLLAHPGHSATYGLYSPSAPHRSATGVHSL